MRRLRYTFVAVCVVASILGPAGTASAAPGVTMSASDKWLTFGDSTLLSGKIEPAAAGETVTIVDQAGKVRGQDTTNAQGRYAVELEPRREMRVHAEWLTHGSDSILLRLRPIVSVSMETVRLFDRVTVRGRIFPAVESGQVLVALKRNGSPHLSKRVRPRDGRFSTTFYVGQPGSYRARAVYDGPNYSPGWDGSDPSAPQMPSLGTGSRSIFVRNIERRLMSLGYRLGKINRRYDGTTADAVRAFNKVQGRQRVGSVSESTWRALASPRIPRPRFQSPRYHVEVDQTKQVLYRVRRGKVITVLHVSTGAGGATRDGTFTFYRRLNGYSPNRLYHPVYFDGLRAIHGWPEVPTYPASHGCVRVPMWVAEWLNGKVALGDKIRIYH